VRGRRSWPALVLGTALACGRGAPPPPDDAAAAPPPAEEPPVALNPDPPIQYPPRLYDQTVEGTVVLRLFVDSTGKLAPESTRVAESSGYSALDSAAMARPTPVLPEVASTINPPGLSRPSRSAASIIATPMRSFTEPPGLKNSALAYTGVRMPCVTAFSRTRGVQPIVSRTLA